MGTPTSFALVAAAGFITPHHMKAIKETSNVLMAVVNTNDSAAKGVRVRTGAVVSVDQLGAPASGAEDQWSAA